MPKNYNITIVCSLLLICARPAAAEFYQYIDSKGTTHYTDTFSTVPTEYRSQLEQHHENITLPAPPYAEGEKTAEVPAKTETESHEITKLLAEKKILLDKKEALNKKFEILIAEKQEIENSKGDMKDEANVARYNNRVQKINKKFNEFKKEEKRFMWELDKFNKSINQPETE